MPVSLLQGLPGLILVRPADKRSAISLSAILEQAVLLEAAARLRGAHWFLEDITGLHVSEGLEIDYYFSHWSLPGRVVLRVVAALENPVLPSLCPVYPGAEWHERETADFFGLTFEGNPNPLPLLLPEDAPFAPLRRAPGQTRSLRALLPQDIFIATAATNPGEQP